MATMEGISFLEGFDVLVVTCKRSDSRVKKGALLGANLSQL